jgi:hypothetical protein
MTDAAAQPSAFDSSLLRRLAVLSWGFPILWYGGSVLAAKAFDEDVVIQYSLKYCLLPVWLTLACHAAYYAHLLARRFGFGWRPIAVIGGMSAVALAFLAGLEAGFTAWLCFAAALGFAFTWSLSVARLLGVQRRITRWLLACLGVTLPFCAAALLLAICYFLMFRNHFGERATADLMNWCVAVMVCAALVLLAGIVLSWLSRRAARRIIAAAQP